MTKSSDDHMIAGVCGGLGEGTPIPSWLWRAGFLFAFLAFGTGLLVYIILCICMPRPTDNSNTGAPWRVEWPGRGT